MLEKLKHSKNTLRLRSWPAERTRLSKDTETPQAIIVDCASQGLTG